MVANGRLHTLTIQLVTNSAPLQQQWERVFAGWLQPPSAESAHFHFRLEVVPELPALPSEAPFFIDEQDRILAVYQGANDCFLLHFLDGGVVEVALETETVSGRVLAPAITNGRFEDIIFTSLAPLLRRRQLFLVHAFAASKNGRCALFVGESHSGKTTTGLNLLLHGWELLANDVVLLETRPDGVYAWPTPGTLGIRAKTFALLPELHRRLDVAQAETIEVTADRLVNGRWSAPTKVTTLFFPQIMPREETAVLLHNRAIALTQLMSESVDRWDDETLEAHISCLEQLCQQATSYRLQLGQNMLQMEHCIEAAALSENEN